MLCLCVVPGSKLQAPGSRRSWSVWFQAPGGPGLSLSPKPEHQHLGFRLLTAPQLTVQ